ncbi:hypothetical protein GP486_001621 [Trichoglossum hirsutum]|uniref:Uncharacterized protein n=1 Tax=Trichoglossum hirsutum TaxID=265104 RepID=A0A9P8LGI3_9PEZI|nr:hypothetical protein GP486_001621 [Trichoglossum hirsutum]
MRSKKYCITSIIGGNSFIRRKETLLGDKGPRPNRTESTSSLASRSNKLSNFFCSQHQCFDCEQKTANVGSMVFRCHWWERGYCEDCMDWDKTQLVGDSLIEYELLDFPPVDQAYYIVCSSCTEHHQEDEQVWRYCEYMRRTFGKHYQDFLEDTSAPPLSTTEDLTDVTTAVSSMVHTPHAETMDLDGISRTGPKSLSSPGKRKSTGEHP